MKTLSLTFKIVRQQSLPQHLYIGLASALCLFFLSVSIQAGPGDIDFAFGTGGKVVSPFTQNALSNAVLVQPDGKIIVAGGGFGGPNSLGVFALVRYHPGGLMDTSFGTNGIVLTPMQATPGDRITDAVLLPDGKIVVAGRAVHLCCMIPGSVFGVARYLSNGTLDPSFSDDGKVLLPGSYDVPTGVKVQKDGKILVAGTTGLLKPPYQFMIVRLNTDGTIDSSFADGRIADTFIPLGDSTGEALALQLDGKIIIAGRNNFNPNFSFGIARYLVDGTLDPAFGINGIVLIPTFGQKAIFGQGTNMITQPDGKIILVGTTSNTFSNSSDLVVLRLDSNGTPDNTFGDNGKVVTLVSDVANVPSNVVYQPDGKLIVAGYSFDAGSGSNATALLVRYNPNGSLDPSFGDGGIVITPNYSIFRSALQSDGKIVTINQGFNIVRYHGDAPHAKPRRDFDFNGDGLTDFAVARNADGYHNWYVGSNPVLGSIIDQEWGYATDKIVPADYDGDGKTDVAVFRDGTWYILQSSNNSFSAVAFGLTNDTPLPFDYTGDGRAELAVYRSGIWYLLDLSTDQFQAIQFGISSDKPVPADYDGDGKSDIAVYRDGVWYWLRSSDNGFSAVQFGIASDVPVVGDYDGDGRVDQAVYRSGVWYVLGSTQGFYAVQFGIASDTPVPADYDGDGKTDVAVFRDGVWYMLRSQQGFSAINFGTANDIPIHAAFVP